MRRPAAARRPAQASSMALVALLPVAVLLAGCASVEAGRAFRRGTVALDRGDAATAVGELERAAALAPEASAVHNHLGIAYEAAGRPADAQRAYTRAVELDCENEAAGRNLAALRTRGSARGAP